MPHGLFYYITHGFIVQLLYATWFDHWQRWQPLDNWCRTSSGNFSGIKVILILMLIVNIILNFTFSVVFVLFNPLPAEFLKFQFRNLKWPAKNLEPGQVAWLCKQLRFKQSLVVVFLFCFMDYILFVFVFGVFFFFFFFVNGKLF